MLESANQDVVNGRYAELTGLAPQLTTPSRHHSHLVDIWFGVQWRERSAEWEESFQRLANGRRPDPDTPSFFSLFAHAVGSGLIVARQVRPDRAVWSRVEAEARSLLAMVDRDVAARRSPPPKPPAPPSKPSGWSLRMREAQAFLSSILWLGEQKPTLPSVTEIPIRIPNGSTGGGR
jgi:hypothetical protein